MLFFLTLLVYIVPHIMVFGAVRSLKGSKLSTFCTQGVVCKLLGNAEINQCRSLKGSKLSTFCTQGGIHQNLYFGWNKKLDALRFLEGHVCEF